MSAGRSAVTTHVLDTARGLPAAGVIVRLERVASSGPARGGGRAGEPGGGEIARARTDLDGRITDLGPSRLPAGIFRLVFETGEYFAGLGDPASFFPEVAVTFRLGLGTDHYHVPLLLSPFAYSTYRGS